MATRSAVVWHRRELRLGDNPLYSVALAAPAPRCLAAVYVFDAGGGARRRRASTCAPEAWDAGGAGAGPFATRFALEALADLRQALRARGSELIVRRCADDGSEDAPRVVADIAMQISKSVGGPVDIVYAAGSPPESDEAREEELLQRYLKEIGWSNGGTGGHALCAVPVRGVNALFHPDDLPATAEEWTRLAHPRDPKRGSRARKKTERARKKWRGSQRPSPPPSQQQQRTRTDAARPSRATPPPYAGQPRVMGEWRRAARASATVRAPVPAPTSLPPPPPPGTPAAECGDIPELRELLSPMLLQHPAARRPLFGLPPEFIESAVAAAEAPHVALSAHPLCGGESAALARLEHFLGDAAAADSTGDDDYTSSRPNAEGVGNHGNARAADDGGVAGAVLEPLAASADRGAAGVGVDGSAKLGAYLATGCVSPRQVHARVQTAMRACSDEALANRLRWVGSHLEIRDFFAAQAMSLGARLYSLAPLKALTPERVNVTTGQVRGGDPEPSWLDPSTAANTHAWTAWARGCTGLPLVDAAMRELAATGYCSNRVRQNAASVLAKDLRLDWRAGAELFEFLLVDSDVASNWGNWSYFAGTGADPKERHFRTVSQGRRYDPRGTYVRAWLPQLRDEARVPDAHWPFDTLVSPDEWPEPIVDPCTQLTWEEAAGYRKHAPEAQ